MHTEFAVPGFGQKLRPASYYTAVDEVLKDLRPTATLRAMANKLNSLELLSPAGKLWNRKLISVYLSKRDI